MGMTSGGRGGPIDFLGIAGGGEDCGLSGSRVARGDEASVGGRYGYLFVVEPAKLFRLLGGKGLVSGSDSWRA